MKAHLFIINLFFIVNLQAQSLSKWEVNGYISLMGSAKSEKTDSLFGKLGSNTHYDALLHNRINLFFYPNSNLSFSVQMRNRLVYNEYYSDLPGVDKNFELDQGWMQLSKNFFYEGDYLLNSSLDRLYMQYTWNKLEVKIGRQRINWSQCFAWNPNDIFNASNYFDIDYPEKPGSDAIRIQYFTGMASSAELVVKIDHLKNLTLAGMYRFNLRGYDLQMLGGILNQEEWVLGTGWSGYIADAGFRGEFTYVNPYKESSDYGHSMNNLFLGALSFDYIFSNSVNLMAEFLYSNNDISSLSSSFELAFSSTTTIHNMAFSRFSSLISASYPIHPLINSGISAMLFNRIDGFYIGPNTDISISDNWNLSVFWQFFKMYLTKENINGFGDLSINYWYFRLKYNF